MDVLLLKRAFELQAETTWNNKPRQLLQRKQRPINGFIVLQWIIL
ncbi:hypothetical protein DAI22_08g125400 [Oryza sativa Japonica Group]|nr:hypothetical protein DAI22_08g125400 [Oryza sativa Japonica Group]